MIAAYLLKNGPDAGDNSGDSFVRIDPSGGSFEEKSRFIESVFREERKKKKNVIASIVTLLLAIFILFSNFSRRFY